MTPRSLIVALAALPALASGVWAHPIPRDNHDRNLVIRLTPEAVVVDYRLEVDQDQAARDLERGDATRIRTRKDFFDRYADQFARLVARNLVADLDGKPLAFTCVRRRWTELEKDNSLTCDFHLRAAWRPTPDGPNRFGFVEANFHDDDFSPLRLTLAADFGVNLREVRVPGEALVDPSKKGLGPGDRDARRTVRATFVLAPGQQKGIDKPGLYPVDELPRRIPRRRYVTATARIAPSIEVAFDKPGPPPSESDEPAATGRPRRLLHLLLDSRQGVLVLLLLAAGFGAVHALTPGHGKTLVAAYLVGERGTVWHALLLGLVVTVTHTAAVLVLAALLPWFFPKTPPASVQLVLGLVGGLLITGLGLWLLFTRLAGRADHVHIGGGHHHHHHDHDHDHDHAKGPVSKWGLIVLGMSGGIVPCWDAIAMLCLAVSAQQLWLGLPLLLAFSAGLAGVLIAIGIGVVYARDWAGSRWGGGPRFRRLLRALPVVSAAVVTALGLWLCYDSVQEGKAPAAATRSHE